MDQDNQDSLSKKHRLQSELLIRESDFRKDVQKKEELEIVIRQAQRKIALLQEEIEKSKKEMAKIDSENMILENEMKKLRKEINNL